MSDAGEDATPENEHEDDTPGLDRTKLLREVAAQMDNIEEALGDGFTVLGGVSVVLIGRPDGQIGFRVRPIDVGPLEGVGILSVAQDVLKAQVLAGGTSED